MAELIDIAGIGRHQAAKFAAVGITSQQQLLAAAATPAARAELVLKVDATMEQILNWANRADLARVSGIDDDCADLLEEAGVDTVPELAQRNPEHLHARLVGLNEEKIVLEQLPDPSEVSRWVAEAKLLPRALHY